MYRALGSICGLMLFFSGCRFESDTVLLEPLEPIVDPQDTYGVVVDWVQPSWGLIGREAYDFARNRYVPLTFWTEYGVRVYAVQEEVRQVAMAEAWAVFYRDPVSRLQTVSVGEVAVDRFGLVRYEGGNFQYYGLRAGPNSEFAQSFWGRPNRWAVSGAGGIGPDTLGGPRAPLSVPRLLNPDLEPNRVVSLDRDWRLWWDVGSVAGDTLYVVFEVWDPVEGRVLERTLWAVYPDDGYARLPYGPVLAWRERVRARWPRGRQELELRVELLRQRLLAGAVRGYGPVWLGTATRYRLEGLRLRG